MEELHEIFYELQNLEEKKQVYGKIPMLERLKKKDELINLNIKIESTWKMAKQIYKEANSSQRSLIKSIFKIKNYLLLFHKLDEEFTSSNNETIEFKNFNQKFLILNKTKKTYSENIIKEFSFTSLPEFRLILEKFINTHTVNFKSLENNSEELNNLIQFVVLDHHISDIEKQFLIEKTKELELSKDLIDQANEYINSNYPSLDKIFSLIFSDGVITNTEISFISEKIQELKISKNIVNKRFWQYGIHFNINDLLKVESFKKWVIAWYLLDNHTCFKNDPKFSNTENVFDIFSNTDFNDLIRKNLALVEANINDELNVNDFEEIYNFVLQINDQKIEMDLSKLSKLHKDSLCWFIKKRNSEITLSDLEGKHHFVNGNTFLMTRAKGIFKPQGNQYCLSIKVLLNSKYDDKISISEDGSFNIKYHKEDNNNWTNIGLKKCMEDKIPVGFIYQINESSPSKYKIYGLGLVKKFDGEYFYIVEIDRTDREYFNWDPNKPLSKIIKKLTLEEEEIIQLNNKEPFLALQKFKKYYKTKYNRNNKIEIAEAFENLMKVS